MYIKNKFILNDFIQNPQKLKTNSFLVLQFRWCFFSLNKIVEQDFSKQNMNQFNTASSVEMNLLLGTLLHDFI